MKRIFNLLSKTYHMIVHALWKVIKFLIFAKLDWLKIINNISIKKIVIFYIIFFCFGRCLLFYNPIRFDYIHQVILTLISLMAICSLKYAYVMTNKLKKVSSGLIYTNKCNLYNTKTMQMIVNQMINIQQSIWWPILMLIPAIGFIRKNIYLGFVQKNPAGYYAVIFGASTYYIALLGYANITIALLEFYKVAKDEGGCIPLDFPSDAISPPEWLSLWNQLFQRIVKVFFCVGTLFTLEYVMLMPKDIVTIVNKTYTFNVCDVKAFVISWSTIFIFIIIGFPIISVLIRTLQKILIKNLSKKIKKEYKLLFSNNWLNNNSSALNIWVYKQLLETTAQYKSYIPTSKNIIPIVSTIISFSLNMVKFYESILLPFFNFGVSP